MKDVCVQGHVGVGGCGGGEVSVEVQADAGSALSTGHWNATSLSAESRGRLLPSVVVDGERRTTGRRRLREEIVGEVAVAVHGAVCEKKSWGKIGKSNRIEP
jgi:hypothetical protein